MFTAAALLLGGCASDGVQAVEEAAAPAEPAAPSPPADPAGFAAARNFVREAVDAALAGRAPAVAETKPYG